LQKFNKTYTIAHLRIFIGDGTYIPITIPTSRDYIGERPRMQIDEDGCASVTTGWSKIVRYAKLKEDNICMFCFYNGGPGMGCFLKNLEK
jgi:hypothetical protein